MKAYQVIAQTGPSGLKLVDLPEPRPGAGQVLVRVRATSLNYRDLMVFEAMNRAITLHRLKPVIDRVFPLAEAPEAYRYQDSGAHFGKVVISIP